MKLDPLKIWKKFTGAGMAKNTLTLMGGAGFVQDVSPQLVPGNSVTTLHHMLPGPSGLEQAPHKSNLNFWTNGIGAQEIYRTLGVKTGFPHSVYFHSVNGNILVDSLDLSGASPVKNFRKLLPADVPELTKDNPLTFAMGQGVVSMAAPGFNPGYWDVENDEFKPFSGLGEIEDFSIVREFRGFLLGLQVKYTSKPDRDYSDLVWSNPHQYEEPPSSWDFTDPKNNAGRTTLDSGGDLLDSLPLGDMNFLYKKDAVYRMTYTGGDFVFRFTPAFSGYGILTTGCVLAFGNKHFVVGDGQLYIHDGANTKEVGNNIVNDWFYERIDENHTDKVFVIKRESKSEIWVCYPTGGSNGYCSEALVWNWELDQFGLDRLPLCTTAYEYGKKELSGELAFQDALPPYYGKYLSKDRFWATDGETSYVQRLCAPLGPLSRDGQVRPNFDRLKVVREVRFQVDTRKNFTFMMGTQEDPDEPIVWYDPVEVFPDDKVISYPISGTFLSYRLVIPSPKSNISDFVLKQITFTFEMMGDL